MSVAYGAQWAETGSTLSSAFNQADRKMYKDKRKHYHCFTGELHPENMQ